MKLLLALFGVGLAWKLGILNKLGIPLPVSLYKLTPQDVEEIASHYQDGHSTFRVAGMTLGDALRQAIETHRIAAYNVQSKYCQGLVSPQQMAGGAGVAAMATGGFATADGVAAEIPSLLGQTTAQTFGTTVATAIPIIGAIAAIGTAIFGFISHHHAEAVAKENKILCPLIPALDGLWTHIDQQLANGQLSGENAKQAVLAVQVQAHSVINEDRSSGALNAVGQQADAITEAYLMILEKSGETTSGDSGASAFTAMDSQPQIVQDLRAFGL